jgi:hypothetical protein
MIFDSSNSLAFIPLGLSQDQTVVGRFSEDFRKILFLYLATIAVNELDGNRDDIGVTGINLSQSILLSA